MRRRGRGWLWRAGAVAAAGLGLFLAASAFVALRYRDRILPPERAPSAPVAVVFGAGLGPSGIPSPVLAERVDAAIALYRAGKVQKLLLSGDNSDRYHDETSAMRRYALQRGLPESDVVGDFGGLSTYDTCYRAKEVFEVDHALLVTQAFHLPRALFIANSLGIDAFGVPADGPDAGRSVYSLRELFSRPLALAMVLLRPTPRFLTAEPSR